MLLLFISNRGLYMAKFKETYPVLHWLGWGDGTINDESFDLPCACNVCPFAKDLDDVSFFCHLKKTELRNGHPICKNEDWKAEAKKEIVSIAVSIPDREMFAEKWVTTEE